MLKFIGKNVPSSKNSRIFNSKTKKSFPSRLCREYVQTMEDTYINNLNEWKKMTEGLEYPLVVGFYFLRDSRRKYDIINALQLPMDLFQEYGYIPDDDSKHIIPIFIGEEVVKKEEAGFYVKIITKKYKEIVNQNEKTV